MKPEIKAIVLAFALTAASVFSQIARGQDLEPSPPQTIPSSKINISQPLLMRQSNVNQGITATLIVDCSIPKTYLTLKGANGGADIYTFDREGVPTIDAIPPTGVNATPELKASVIAKMMRELGQRQIDDFSPSNLCRDGQPSRGAATAILNFITRGAAEFDI